MESDTLEQLHTKSSESASTLIKPNILNKLRNDKTDRFNLKCPQCPIDVKTKEERDEHIERSHQKVPCHKCDSVYDDLNKMQEHYKEDHLFKCLFDCATEIAFNSVELLQKHMDDVHTFKCDLCVRTFTKETTLRFHHQVVHSIEFQCHLCALQFASEELVQKHIQVVHKFQCTQCPRHFTTDTALLFHYDVTHLLESYCHLCNQSLANKTALTHHINAQHSFKCPWCTVVCLTQGALTVHEYLHADSQQIYVKNCF